MKNLILLIILLSGMAEMLFANGDTIQSTPDHPNEYVRELIEKARDNIENNTKTAYYYLEEALTQEKHIHDSLKGDLYYAAGKLYFMIESYDISFEYLQKALEIQNQIDSLKSYGIYNRIGTIYLVMKDYEKSRSTYLRAKQLVEQIPAPSESDLSIYHAIMNNLAVLERDDGNLMMAKNYIEQSLNSALAEKDTTHLILLYHNLSNIYFDLDNYKEGSIYLNQAINFATLTESNRELALLLKNRGVLFSQYDNNADSAIFYATKALDLGVQIGHPLIQKEAAILLFEIYKRLGDFEKALEYKELEQKLANEAINAENIKKITSIELNARYEQNKRALIAQQKRNLLILYTIIILISLGTIVFILLFRLQKSKADKRKLQNEILREKLAANKKEFTAKIMHTMQITEILNTTHKELLSVREESNPEVRKKLTSIITNLRHKHLSFNWDEFEKLFIETNQDFYDKLLADFPDLSKNELRICAFLKMNLSTKEISAITNQSYRSIVVARSRLRKKLGIETEQQSITSFLAGY